MQIAGVGSAFPRHYYSQQQIAAALKRHWSEGLQNPEVLDRLFARVGVKGRYLALPIPAYDDLTTWGKANAAWIETAEELAEQSLCKALTRAGLSERDVDAIFFVSVTGIASPSIDARLINHEPSDGCKAAPDLWPGMCCRGGRRSPRCGLRTRLSPSGGCAHLGRTVLAHLAAQ